MIGETYAIGIDFGTDSGRAVLVHTGTGEEVADHVYTYPHGVITEQLPEEGVPLQQDWALQHPEDYIGVLTHAVPEVLEKAGIDAKQVIAVGVDFTACTVVPIGRDGMPLCMHSQYRANPHSWVKLWKHHASQKAADVINRVAREQGETFLQRYGGKISSEWLFPKILQVLQEAPDIYHATNRFMEAADWIVTFMTGREARNSCAAGYKGMWHKADGYPSESFFERLHPQMKTVVRDKLSTAIYPTAHKAGGLLPEIAERMGLEPGTAVAVGTIDAHAAVPAMGVVEPEKMVMVMGTSICHLFLAHDETFIEGIAGVVEDGIIPGYFGYEAGQPAGGDMLKWFASNGVPPEYHREADQRNMSIYELLEAKALAVGQGKSGLLALDWWNGNRSTLADSDLTGMIVGLTLNTKPEEIYLSLMEAIAFGTQTIIETVRTAGIEIKELYACGGLTKNRLLMQIIADVTGMNVTLPASTHTSALGAAILATASAGAENGGYHSVTEAVRHMAQVQEDCVEPIPAHRKRYTDTYKQYRRLYNYFGRDGNSVMKVLKQKRQSELNEGR